MTARATPGRSEARYRKLKLDAALDQQLSGRLFAPLRNTMQATSSLLPDVEILSLGGDSLRGIRIGQLFDDEGSGTQAELRMVAGDGREAYLFIDHGWASYRRRPSYTDRLDQSLSIVGVGLRVAAARSGLEGNVGLAHVLATHGPPASGLRLFATA